MADLGSSLQSVLQVPGLQELLNQSITRQRELAPLRTAVSQQAVNMLPNSAFTRPDIGAIPRANYATPAPSGGADWAKILSLLGAGVAGGGLLAKLLGGGGGGGAPGSPGAGAGGNLANLVNGLKKLFQHGGNGYGGPDTGPASVPGGSSDFNDWAFNTDSFNPETQRQPPLSTSMFPGYTDPRSDPMYGDGASSGGGGDSSGGEDSYGDE